MHDQNSKPRRPYRRLLRGLRTLSNAVKIANPDAQVIIARAWCSLMFDLIDRRNERAS